MKHDLNKAKSYEHMMGTERREHLGSQSKAPGKGEGSPMVRDTDNDGE